MAAAIVVVPVNLVLGVGVYLQSGAGAGSVSTYGRTYSLKESGSKFATQIEEACGAAPSFELRHKLHREIASVQRRIAASPRRTGLHNKTRPSARLCFGWTRKEAD